MIGQAEEVVEEVEEESLVVWSVGSVEEVPHPPEIAHGCRETWTRKGPRKVQCCGGECELMPRTLGDLMPMKVQLKNRFRELDDEVEEGIFNVELVDEEKKKKIGSHVCSSHFGLEGIDEAVGQIDAVESHFGSIHFGSEEINEAVEITIDSGASKSVWPKGKKGVARKKLLKKPKLAAANGTEITVEGEAMLEFESKGKRFQMQLLEAGVKRPLGSVAEIVDEGNMVVFRKQGSYIQNETTGEKLWMERRGGMFILSLKGLDAEKVKGNVKQKIEDMDVGEAVEKENEDEEDEWKKMQEVAEKKFGKWVLVFRRQVQ